MPLPRALIFDVDGTLLDTEAMHRAAFNSAFEEEGLSWRWDEALYTRLLSVAGGKERLSAYWREVESGPVREDLLARVHATKTSRFVALAADGALPLRPGIATILRAARDRGLPMAIATTTTPANVDALLGPTLGPAWRSMFAVVADAASASRKKPDPEVYLYVLERLGLRGEDCLAFEDSENGLSAARAARIPTVVTPTAFTRNDDFDGALAVHPDLGAVRLEELLAVAARS